MKSLEQQVRDEMIGRGRSAEAAAQAVRALARGLDEYFRRLDFDTRLYRLEQECRRIAEAVDSI